MKLCNRIPVKDNIGKPHPKKKKRKKERIDNRQIGHLDSISVARRAQIIEMPDHQPIHGQLIFLLFVAGHLENSGSFSR